MASDCTTLEASEVMWGNVQGNN